jgi:hypothetical protein
VAVFRHDLIVGVPSFRFLVAPRMPDALFSDQKSHFGYIFEGLRFENVDVFYGHLEYWADIWNIL